LRDLVCSFPSFARRQILDSSNSDGLIEPSSPMAAAASPKPAAAAAAAAAGHLGTLSSPQPSASPKQHAAAPWASPNTQPLLHNTGLFSNYSRHSAAAAAAGGEASPRSAVRRGAAGVVSAGAVELTNSSSNNNDSAEVGGAAAGGGGGGGGGRVSRSGSPIPPSKALTAEEAEKLASLYK
jgi:hypothetical protein